MIVDVHAHYYPEGYRESVGRGTPPADAGPLGRRSLDERLELLDRVGIDTQVLSISATQPYLPGAAESARAAKLANDAYVEVCEDHPGRFLAFAALPLPHISESLQELERVMGDPHVVGVTIGCSVAGRELDDPLLAPVFQELDRRKTVVFLHPVFRHDFSPVCDYGLDGRIGAPFEDTVTAMRLVLGGVTTGFPDIRFIVPHLGGALPLLFARVARQRGPGEPDVREHLRRMYFDTVAHGYAPAAVCACKTFGAERLLFGTDYPYSPDEQAFERHVRYLDECELSPSQVTAILGETAAGLLGLGSAKPA